MTHPDLVAQGLLGLSLIPAALGWRRQWYRPLAPVSVLLAVAVGVLGLVEPAAQATERTEVTGVLLTCLLLAILGGGPVTSAVFRLIDGPTPGASSMRRAGTVLRGGAWIGALERGGVFAALIAGWPEGLAVVLALKGLGRYPELRNEDKSGVAERFIIGTFTSVLWAVGAAGLAVVLT